MKKVPVVYLIVFLLRVLLTVRPALADVAADLNQAEGLYKAGQYTQAEQAYLKAIREADPNKPAELEVAFTARKKLPLVYIATDRLPQAKDAVQQLLSRHARHEFLPHAIHEIVEGAKPLYKLAQVRQVYQDMVTARPDDSQAIWLKMGMAIASVHLTDDQATDAVLQNIIAQHGADDRAAEVLNHIAWACRKLKQYNKALTVYQYAVDNWPQKDRVAFSQHGIVICHLGLGNRPAADEALNVLLQKFGKDKNASKLVLWAAQGYSDAGESEGACKVFELVVQNYPDTQEAIEAQAALAITSVQAEDRNRIEPAVQTLLARFAPNEVKALGLHNVANTLAWKHVTYVVRPPQDKDLPGLYNKCLLAIANYTLANWPKSDWAMWAERDLATVAIQRGDDPTADAAIGRLTTDYVDRKDTPAALNFLADYCLELKKHNKAEAVYQYLIKQYPNYELVPLAKAELAVIQIRQGHDPNADAIFQEIMAKHANHPKLAEAMNLIALGYYTRAHMGQGGDQAASGDGYRKALKVWEAVINDLPQSPGVAQAYYHSAVVLDQELGEHDRALAYYRKVAESWPNYTYAWHAQFSVGDYYLRLRGNGTVPKDEADRQIANAYRTVVERYPDCRYAGYAALRLGQLLYEKSQWLEAAKYLERFLQKQPSGSSEETLGVLFHLALVYERMGEVDAAAQVRRRFTELAGPEDPRVQLLQTRPQIVEREVRK